VISSTDHLSAIICQHTDNCRTELDYAGLEADTDSAQ